MAKLTTFRKEEITCPICNNSVKEEFMLTGGLRQVSVKMNEELRTIYKDYQDLPVIPFIYEVITCPKCLFSAFIKDFKEVIPQKPQYTERETRINNEFRVALLKENALRAELIKDFGNINFVEPKTLVSSIASHILAIKCYDHFSDKLIPTAKQAVLSLRTVWLCKDKNLKELEFKYYKLAHKYYSEMLSKPDTTDGFKLGPDWGNNFGFEGARYIKAMLDFKNLNSIKDAKEQMVILKDVRSVFSKIRGFGKASQNKKGPLLKMAEDMFDKIQPYFDKLKEKLESDGTDISSIKIEIKEDKPVKPKEEKIVEKKEVEEKNIFKDASTEIVKYAIQKGIKRDSILDIEKILKKYFKE